MTWPSPTRRPHPQDKIEDVFKPYRRLKRFALFFDFARDAGCVTVGDLSRLDLNQVLRVKGVGRKTLIELRDQLHEAGLKFLVRAPRVTLPKKHDDDLQVLGEVSNRVAIALASARTAERERCCAILASAQPNTRAEAVIERVGARIRELPDWLVPDIAEWLEASADELADLQKRIRERTT